ncbi:LuxR C-terminal-related transcriptional regulator [Amycolatopsis sp. CA-230715]|uniref:LuxR C-terminal-related transcriptional regulator n=1 Tax=Amycolatopsis sp. CA-230715 TaxID=2745196 RepID=UPI001C009EAB|nr:response regulator transcription factor [Amycolatopsis sp. CA-230715]QWF82468.1 Transcriptional regulatory protein DegU [Amycolatopsis sp. CA-230715]
MLKSTNSYSITEWKYLEDANRTAGAPGHRCPDVVVLGCNGLNTDTVQLYAERARAAGSKVLLLLLIQNPELFDAVSSIPANGFLLLHQITPDSLDRALREVVSGEIVIPSVLAGRMLTRLRTGSTAQRHGLASLTPREEQALRLLVDGLSNKQIAKQLRISQHGAKRLVANVLAKLNCPNRTLAVAVALRDNIIA